MHIYTQKVTYKYCKCIPIQYPVDEGNISVCGGGGVIFGTVNSKKIICNIIHDFCHCFVTYIYFSKNYSMHILCMIINMAL